jgi:hypothetical protein
VKVSACLVTRGDCDLTPILETLPFDDIVVWNNSVREDLGIYGRYAAIEEAKHDVIYTQDDDVLVTCHQQLLDAYDGRLLCNYPQPWDIPWVARGALFHRDMPRRAFDRYLAVYPFDRFLTHFGCDGIFSLLTPHKVVNFGSVDLPHGFAEGRVSTSPGWYDDKRPEIQVRAGNL